MKKLILFLLTLSSVGLKQTFGQIVPRSLEAKRTTKAVIIDGNLNDLAWQDAAKADDYTVFRLVIGRKEEKGNHKETFLMNDDEVIYFGGTCFERTIDSIANELAGRDGSGTTE